VQSGLAGDGGEDMYLPTGDGFFAIINPASSSLVYSTYFGGSMDDAFTGMVMDASGNAWLTGYTLSESGCQTKGAVPHRIDLLAHCSLREAVPLCGCWA